MEKVHGSGTVPARGNNIELEKFKRRLIRAVARMLIHEKRNEDEVWAGLKKETGCDCKELWNRMYALTVKKLERLLEAEDRVNQLPKAARMSITDWLMFDTVLVHEEFDVIGMSETVMEDRKVLVDLFELVEEHKIEFLAGNKLTEAWLRLTMSYNKQERQCTPMLLQRRWYQLKLATRARFYKFWSMYKGVARRRHLGEAYKPTPLQATIAMRYKPLVVKPFMVWEELIRHCLVILPEQFECKGNNFQTNKASKGEDMVPDVMCVEPVVETIDLDSDSDLELEYRKPINNDDPATITIKKEPVDDIDIDENTPYENRQERMLHFAEAAMEATAMELDEIELADDSVHIQSPNAKVDSESLPNEQSNKEIILDNLNRNQDNIIHLNEVNPIVEDTLCVIEDENNAIPPISENHINVINDGNDVNSVSGTTAPSLDNEIKSLLVSDTIVKEVHVVEDEGTEDNDIEMQMEPEPVLPQITSVFGGVDISNETLSKISLLTAQITNSAIKDKPENTLELQIAFATSIALNSDSSDALNNDVLVPDDTLDDKPNSEVDAKVTKNTWFGELSNDIDFADDGIQLVDDDDESAYHISEIKTEIKCDIDEEDISITEKVEDVPKVDEKLLMVPTVILVKLDDMNILPLHLLKHIDSKNLIDIIAFKNNPIKKSVLLAATNKEVDISVPIKEEVDASVPINTVNCPSIRIQFEDDESESNDEDIIDESKRVKLSSILLQKPRSRSYNPINLCKNPDFNTRLKKLNVGFFSSARNRLLLKACKPLSIDVNKAFENKLVNGIMYLKMSNNDDLHLETDPEVNSQNVSVLPSAMAVQSLIDNTEGDIPPASYSSITLKPDKVVPSKCERNKIINLPDISEIRRINQNLLTAEVTPLRLKSCHTQVPVTLVKTTNIDQSVYSNKYGKAIAGPASRTKLMHSQIVDITKADNTNKDASHAKNTLGNKDSLKSINKGIPWRPRNKPELPWFSNKNSIYSEDTLLALDTLNKMLFLLTETDTTPSDNSGSSKGCSSSKSSKKKKGRPSLKESTLKGDDNDDVQVVSETKLDIADAKLCRKPKINLTNPCSKNSKFVTCCWARERICQHIFTKKKISKHNCPFPLCLCCCRTALIQFMKKTAKDNKNKKTTEAPALDDSAAELTKVSTADVTVAIENKDASADMVEIIPIDEKIAQVSASDCVSNTEIKGDTISTNEAAVNTDTEICTSETIINIDPEISTNESAVNTDTEISMSETIVDIETEIPTNEIAVDTVYCDESIQDLENQINDNSSRDVIIGAEISVTTSKNTASVQSKGDPVTTSSHATTTNTNINPCIKTKPRIRVRSSLGPKVPVEAHLKRKSVEVKSRQSQINRRIVPTENLQTVETPKKVVISIDPSKPFRLRDNITDNPQKTLLIDLKEPNIIPKTYVNQKMIYLNSKQISELPTDNPIFLGKNKILLTTAKFPANFKSFEAYQANLKQTFALPKGIQLVLLPSGRVTYIKDSNQSVSDEFMTALPHLIEAIQHQINGHHAQLTSSQPNNLQPEVIDLSDEETTDFVKDTEKTSSDEVSRDSINQIEKAEKSHTVETSSTEIVTINLDKTKTTETTTNLNTQSNLNNSESVKTHGSSDMMNLTVNIEETKTTESTTNRKTQQSDVNISELVTTNVVESNSEKFNDSIITESAISENTQSDATTSVSVTSNVETVEGDSGKFNNILSDLMAMSGIEPIDVTLTPQESSQLETLEELPVAVAGAVERMSAQIAHSEQPPLQPLLQHSINPPLLQSINSTLERNSPLQLVHTPKEGLADGKMEANFGKILSAALTPITSLSELKYACAQSGAFFKLDLETGLLLPINVCMKKFTENRGTYNNLKQLKATSTACPIIDPKPIIDLTDEDVSDVTEIHQMQPNSLLINQPTEYCGKKIINYNNTEVTNNIAEGTSYKGVDMNFAIASVSSGSSSTGNCYIDPSIDGTNVSKDGQVKPLKLYKAPRVRPTILERKLRQIHQRIKEAQVTQDMLRRKLKRKQELKDSLREENAMNSYNISSSDDSSDEEPLAKIATKMRTAETTGTENTKNVNDPPAGKTGLPAKGRVESTEMEVTDEVPNAVDEHSNDDPNIQLPMEEDEEMPMECLDETILEEDEAEEDCILGV